MTTVLSDKQLKEEILKGNIVLYDPNRPNLEKQIGNCSIDITIGPNFYRHEKLNSNDIFNPWDKTNINHWILCKADDFIILKPNEFILAHTNEFIGGKKCITTMMKARSSIGRNNIQICSCAGWGDINYINRWTMEIRNGNNFSIKIPVGARVGQIVFFYTGETEIPYQGKYQGTLELKNLVETWSPECMLPRLYKDYEQK